MSRRSGIGLGRVHGFFKNRYRLNGSLRGSVGARVTPVAAGVHSLILILTASMTYDCGPA